MDHHSIKYGVFFICLAISALTPLFLQQQTIGSLWRAQADHQSPIFSGWPTTYEGNVLYRLPLSPRETQFTQHFPGKIARFSDGQREIIIRWVAKATRRLHPAKDCFLGVGYRIAPLPVQTNQQGVAMGCFSATRQHSTLQVCEFLTTHRGESWSDVTAWYWQALWQPNANGWWSYVIATQSSEKRMANEQRYTQSD